jgi:hypothetical protein
MSTVSTTVVALTAAANLAIGVADIARARFVLANSAEVGVPESWLPGLAALKMAGGAGLVLGLAGAPAVGVPAGIGLVLFYVGALVAHVRERVLHNIAFPGLFLALASASLLLMATR